MSYLGQDVTQKEKPIQLAKKDSFWREILNFWPLGIALVATSIFGRFTWVLAHQLTRQEGVYATRWEHFLHGRPNELGDTLSGFVGSLTLIWVIASVIQQSLELRAQRKEFSEMVLAQDAQVAALRAQATIFEDEKLRRDQDVTRQYISRIIRSVVSTIKYSDSLAVRWRPTRQVNPNECELLQHWSLLRGESPPNDLEDAFLFYARQTVESSKCLLSLVGDSTIRLSLINGLIENRHPTFMLELQSLKHLCNQAISEREVSSTIEQELLAHLRMDEFLQAIENVTSVFQERFE